MTPPSETSITIVGAGLSGSLLACFLGRRGYRVAVYERRPDPRTRGFIGGRSINLALSARGIDALERVGLAEEVLKDAVKMPGRMMHSVSGNLTFQPYSANKHDAINSVSRGGLNLALIKAADDFDNVSFHFDHRCTGLNPDLPTAHFHHEQTGEESCIESTVVIGADGAFSAVRNTLQRDEHFNYSQSWLKHGYKELTIPPINGGLHDGFALDPHALHIWPRGGFMMIALPNPDRSFTCTCFWPLSGLNSFAHIKTDEEVRSFFEQHFPDAVHLMPTLLEDYQNNPVGSLVTVRCEPWHHQDKVVLIGDAAHAIVPFYGQGINAGFEDCVALDDMIEKHGDHWEDALTEYSRTRKPHADAIADLAIHNFLEMRDRVSSPWFLLGKKLEKFLHRLFPRWFTPLYNMISFSTLPYAEACAKAARQWRIIAVVAATIPVLITLLLLFILIESS